MNANTSKAYIADVDTAPYLVVMAGTVVGNANVALTNTSKLIGVAENVQVAAGQTVDVINAGTGNVLAGGTIADGDYLTANTDGSGSAITALTGNTVFGKAQASAVAGDVVPYVTAFSKLP
jgi:hypothetical protein